MVNVSESVQDIKTLTYRSVVVISCLKDSSGATITTENAENGAGLSASPSSSLFFVIVVLFLSFHIGF